MRPAREFGDHIDDMLQASEKVAVFVHGTTRDQLLQDDKTQLAVVRALEIIGEAAKRIPDTYRAEHPDIRLCAITAKKENVQPHIRTDPNKLYNYMLGLSLLEQLVHELEVLFSPDSRSVKVASGNSPVHCLQIKLWFDFNAPTVLRYNPLESHTSHAIQFVDVATHIIWSYYEDGFTEAYNTLAPHVRSRQLFFGQ